MEQQPVNNQLKLWFHVKNKFLKKDFYIRDAAIGRPSQFFIAASLQ